MVKAPQSYKLISQQDVEQSFIDDRPRELPQQVKLQGDYFMGELEIVGNGLETKGKRNRIFQVILFSINERSFYYCMNRLLNIELYPGIHGRAHIFIISENGYPTTPRLQKF